MQAISNIQSERLDTLAVRFDDKGHLVDPSQWNEDLARLLAENAGLSLLTNSHWRVIYYLRSYYKQFRAMPPPRIVCRRLDIQGHDIKAMFGSCLTVWLISGLPDPGDEAKNYIN